MGWGRIVLDSRKWYNECRRCNRPSKLKLKCMKIDQLPLFLRRSFQKKPPAQILKPVTPTGESSVMQTLVAFQAFVTEKYAPKTAKMYFGDVRELSIYLKKQEITGNLFA